MNLSLYFEIWKDNRNETLLSTASCLPASDQNYQIPHCAPFAGNLPLSPKRIIPLRANKCYKQPLYADVAIFVFSKTQNTGVVQLVYAGLCLYDA